MVQHTDDITHHISIVDRCAASSGDMLLCSLLVQASYLALLDKSLRYSPMVYRMTSTENTSIFTSVLHYNPHDGIKR